MGNLFEGNVIAMTAAGRGIGRECALLGANLRDRMVLDFTERPLLGLVQPGGAGPGRLARRAAGAQRLRRPRPAPSPSGRRRGIEQPGAPLPQVHIRGLKPLGRARPQPCSARPWPGSSATPERLPVAGPAPGAN
jgi:hypothetical protein